MYISKQLACQIGVNESIVLCDLHQLLQETGSDWVVLTYEEWQKRLPFWSPSTIRRVVRKLERLGYIESGNFNKNKVDQTKSYRLNNEELQKQRIVLTEERLFAATTSFMEETEPQRTEKEQHRMHQLNIVLNNQYKHIEQHRTPIKQLGEVDGQADDPHGEHDEADDQRGERDGQHGEIDDQHGEVDVQHGKTDGQCGRADGQNDEADVLSSRASIQDGAPTGYAKQIGSLALLSLSTAEKHMLQQRNLNTQQRININRSINNKDEIEKKNVFSFYRQHHFYPYNEQVKQRMNDWIQKMGAPLVLEALKTALEYGSTSWKYVEAVLTDWQNKHYKTVHDIEQARKRKKVYSMSSAAPIRKECVPDWLEEYKKQWEAPAPPETPVDVEALKERLKRYK
ncbi:DnaD domain-containing protein [Anoxybacteroides amylolyticum]|uniref:DnaD domain protein n=1 Tax=Anoxybacteroides amylolyticum TaxID=294699 RepID=A0A160F458_9BACL|nr:DnaD domain protein [Anoxybacillus amylolyticus]ANB60525.1 DnaD domain protein [Anoxybacillus amylolyticus]